MKNVELADQRSEILTEISQEPVFMRMQYTKDSFTIPMKNVWKDKLFHELEFIQKFLRQQYILHIKWINESVCGLLNSKNQILLVPQHGPVLDLLWGGELQLPQAPVSFTTHFFSRINIEKTDWSSKRLF